MGEHVECDDVLHRRMCTRCTLSLIHGQSFPPSTTSRHFGAETKTTDMNALVYGAVISMTHEVLTHYLIIIPDRSIVQFSFVPRKSFQNGGWSC